MSKFCSKCKRVLDESNFNWKIKNIKLSYHCKDCSREYVKEHYKNNLRYYLDKAKRRRSELAFTYHEYIANYLSTHPCKDCGEKDILVLEFDHKDRETKDFDVSAMSHHGSSAQKMVLEISKCEVRCANCHRRKTAKESNSWKLRYMHP